MTIKSVQKVIKVGDSLAVTLPARDARQYGIEAGGNVEISVKPVENLDHKAEVVELTQKLIKRHKKALKNLSQR